MHKFYFSKSDSSYTLQLHKATNIRPCVSENVKRKLCSCSHTYNYKFHGWYLDRLHPDLSRVLQAQRRCHALKFNSTVSFDLLKLKRFISFTEIFLFILSLLLLLLLFLLRHHHHHWYHHHGRHHHHQHHHHNHHHHHRHNHNHQNLHHQHHHQHHHHQHHQHQRLHHHHHHHHTTTSTIMVVPSTIFWYATLLQ